MFQQPGNVYEKESKGIAKTVFVRVVTAGGMALCHYIMLQFLGHFPSVFDYI